MEKPEEKSDSLVWTDHVKKMSTMGMCELKCEVIAVPNTVSYMLTRIHSDLKGPSYDDPY